MPQAPSDIRSLARQWTTAAIESLGGIATNGEPHAARVAACVALLDRGWGKPAQVHSVDGEGDIRVTIRHIIEGKGESFAPQSKPAPVTIDQSPQAKISVANGD